MTCAGSSSGTSGWLQRGLEYGRGAGTSSSSCILRSSGRPPTTTVSAGCAPDAERAALEARQPSGRLVRPEEVAEAVAYLASPSSGSSNGVILPVDGGMYSLRPRR